MIEVRERTAADLPVLCEVLAAQAEASQYPIRWPWSGPLEEFIVRRGEERAWVAVRSDQPDRLLGHVSVVQVTDTGDGIAAGWMAATGADGEALACISVLFVDHTARGAGIGAALLDVATAWILGRGRIPVLDVVSVHDDVIDLYRRRGWREVGVADPPWLPEARLVLMVLDPPEPREPAAGRLLVLAPCCGGKSSLHERLRGDLPVVESDDAVLQAAHGRWPATIEEVHELVVRTAHAALEREQVVLLTSFVPDDLLVRTRATGTVVAVIDVDRLELERRNRERVERGANDLAHWFDEQLTRYQRWDDAGWIDVHLDGTRPLDDLEAELRRRFARAEPH